MSLLGYFLQNDSGCPLLSELWKHHKQVLLAAHK